MNRPIQFNNHPFRFLLYLEWLLLGFSALMALMPSPSPRFSAMYPELTICSLTIFGLMGLRLPTFNKTNKIIYTALEVILILITGFFGGRSARLFPFLYLILVTRSCLIFQLPGRLTVTLSSFILFIFTLRQRIPPGRFSPIAQERFRFFSFSLAVLFGLSLVFVLLLMNTVLAERQSRDKLQAANEKLRQYALKIESQATLEERNRIAREIHDSLGHSLTALNLQLETALKLSKHDIPRAMTFLATAKELGSKALQDVRQSVSTMRSHPLQGQTLEEAIKVLAADFQRYNGILPTCQIYIISPLSMEISTAIYRIIQESLTNISKYAQATEVRLELITTLTGLKLIIQDNGKGFDGGQNTTGFGLQSMRDRILALGGEFEINTHPGAGCQIIVQVPLLNY
ncbi:sensor histidine kinase [Dolichospermum sp. LEGE 00240]|jgi:signal transduction histidine kinase|uniref:sensor histidine kinase n=1 Tax=Dolichospermum sp. LEGE 00240 TaxID=1828603 RepID=UPI0018805891|nr:sensor histidine kinase [Dolichospermum sp. LEGE 00240]MDM3847144.1 sensor histidine kinase [Aphanizomenon gracile PMC638.10]MDM3849399.1 sensor histidine kinase [Aphanizomenon gracile PMC627.10]MDM3855741.1 sensor histidine kinase [Aphanizomenon gracile PMC649.10]MDM3860266.1 sensor histidine kinase [Aphanizomenon gracile PMC644.10]MBE9250387.1 sensor histidine kinase [Dolichospermum sp. LEGE 00240]